MHKLIFYITCAVCTASNNCKTCSETDVAVCTSCETEAVIPRYLMGTACVLQTECIGANFWNTVEKICERKHRS